MKELGAKKKFKQIIYIIIVLMLCNFIIPNFTYAATDPEGGGTIFDPFVKFVTYLCDSLMQLLQTSFTSNESISNGDGTYNFQYSPAIIFSGKVQGLDINFINPNTDVRNVNNYQAFLRKNKEAYVNQAVFCSENQVFGPEDQEKYATYLNLKDKVTQDNRYSKIVEKEENRYVHYIYYYEENNVLYIVFLGESYLLEDDTIYMFFETSEEITDDFLKELNATNTYTSIASELQPTIATWYKALRRIALVGLLSVLVYVGIRIVISSISGKESSKYKKMLTDWLIALCLLFTLHYIMNFTIIVTQKISIIFSRGETDELLNSLRGKIYQGTSWGAVLAEVVMYVVLTIYTFVFTFQYLKRVLYMAFFTMIAPLITLTYPLDKIGDGKAQAFSMWLREYVFNALLQVVHLLVYYTFVGRALDLVELYPIYAIVVIGFITQGEKIIRKMFGFENATTIGTVGAAAAGGLIANAMNKLKSLPKAVKGGDQNSEGGRSNNNGVRTASNNPLSTLQGGAGSSGGGSPTPGPASGPTPSPTAGSGASAGGATKPKKNIAGGITALGKRYMAPALGKVAGGFLGGAGAMVGFAAGVSQGDLGAALTGAMAGGAAGYGLGQRGINAVTNIKNPREKIDEITDIWKEGAYGTEYAQNEKFDREFRKSETYKALKENPNFSEASVQAMLDSGITEKGAMEKILNNSGGNINDAIGYYTLAQKCPDSVYYDDAKLQMYLEDLGLSETNAKTMRDNMKKYR